MQLCALALIVAGSQWGCASIVSGEYAQPMDASGHLARSPKTESGLVVSGGEVTDLSSPYFGFVALTFENQSADWIQIDGMRVTFGGPDNDRRVVIPEGEELASWQRAIAQRNEVREVNAAMAALAVAGSAAAIAASPHERGSAAAGIAGVAGATALVGALGASAAAVERPAAVPETHLLATPFVVPPGLFTKRWIVLGTPGSQPLGCVHGMLLEYALATGAHERLWLDFRRSAAHSEWQAQACRSFEPAPLN